MERRLIGVQSLPGGCPSSGEPEWAKNQKSVPAMTAKWAAMQSLQVVFWLRLGAGAIPCEGTSWIFPQDMTSARRTRQADGTGEKVRIWIGTPAQFDCTLARLVCGRIIPHRSVDECQ